VSSSDEKQGPQSTLIGFPQPHEGPAPVAPAAPAPPIAQPPKRAVPPPRSQRDSAAVPLQPQPYPYPYPQSQSQSQPQPQGPTPGAPQPYPNAHMASGPTVPNPFPSPGSGPNASPYPIAPSSSGPTVPYAQAPSGPIGVPQGPYAEQPSAPAPQPWLAHEHAARDSMEEVPGSQFVSFLKISLRRAFRLRIEPSEVLPSERDSLLAASPPIVDANLQAFLAWRRSVLFLVSCSLAFLAVLGVSHAIAGSMATPIRFVKLAPAVAEGVFAYICWNQLRNWAHWRRQRKMLMFGWFLFMAMPFIVFLYPLRSAIPNKEDLIALGFTEGARQSVQPFMFAMLAMLQLAPKAISLMPGLIRASLVIKLLFPGSSAPGWLMVVAAPIYALLAYVILVIPYQFTGSGWFIAGVLGVIGGQALLARAGYALAQPLSEDEAVIQVGRVRRMYVSVMVGSGILIMIAIWSLVDMLHLSRIDVFLTILKFETNVLVLTMIGSDLVITHLDRARKQTAGKDHVEDLAELKIAAFVSLDAPHLPPPSGPAPGFDR